MTGSAVPPPLPPPLPPLAAIPRDIVSAFDYERHARRHLDDNAWEYLCAGAGDEITLRENRAAFDRLCLLPRVLVDVQGGHTRVSLPGGDLAHPVVLAPVAYQRLFHADGECATALAADLVQACMTVSTLSSVRLENLPAPTQSVRWFQLYFQPTREATLALLRRAEACGFTAVVVTVDAPLAGIRNREQRAGFALPPGVYAANLAASVAASGVAATAQGSPTWADIAWLAGQTRLPVFVKGVIHPDDARRALDEGAAGVVVSNHGGRILDTVPASLAALPAVVAALQGRAPVLLDGGVRRGTDVFKALALGASAVMVGRPYVHALACAGALGVAHLLRTLHEELGVTMALSGCRTLADIGPHCLFTGHRPG